MPKVSVVMPVYNTAPYLDESITSILNQTLEDLELWIVDDGSTDGSDVIIKKYADVDERVHTLRQENKGLSISRNIGMKSISGKYLYFMDSDDILDCDCFKTCFTVCECNDLDFVCFDATNFGDLSGIIQSYDRGDVLINEHTYTGLEMFSILINTHQYKSPVWLNFVHYEYLKKWFDGFYPGVIHEDHLFTVKLLLNSDKCQYINKPFFRRRIRSNSIMTKSFSMKNIIGYETVVDVLIRYSKCNPRFKHHIRLFISQVINAVVWESHKLCLKDKLLFMGWLIRTNEIRHVSLRNLCVFMAKKAR